MGSDAPTEGPMFPEHPIFICFTAVASYRTNYLTPHSAFILRHRNLNITLSTPDAQAETMGDNTGNSTATEHYMKPATRLRKLLSQPGVCIQAPGVYDGICARLAIEQGFQVMVGVGDFVVASLWQRTRLSCVANLSAVPRRLYDYSGASGKSRSRIRIAERLCTECTDDRQYRPSDPAHR